MSWDPKRNDLGSLSSWRISTRPPSLLHWVDKCLVSRVEVGLIEVSNSGRPFGPMKSFWGEKREGIGYGSNGSGELFGIFRALDFSSLDSRTLNKDFRA